MLLGSVPTSHWLKQYLQCLKKRKGNHALRRAKQMCCSCRGIFLVWPKLPWEGGLIAGMTVGLIMAALLLFQTPNFNYWGGLLSTEERGSKMDFLERVHQRSVKIIKGLKHLTYKESSGQVGPWALKRLRGILSVWINVWQEGANKTKLGFSQW